MNEIWDAGMAWLAGLSPSELILGAIALCAAVWMFAKPRILAARARAKSARDADAIKKDLLAWKNLSDLARGGEEADEAKGKLTNRSALLKAGFIQGAALLRENRHVAEKLPWFLIAGEPAAGKSSLLEESGLELTPSAEPQAGENVPLRFWLGGKAVVLDLEGRIFFDRWMGGSSAEMKTLAKLITERHRQLPLSGIILAIPADALIGDDRALTRKKAMLIAAELESLTARLGMTLPCHIVITKLDRVLGFSDYFGELDENMRQQAFGWQPKRLAPGFPEAEFSRYWQNQVAVLREGVAGLMLSRSVIGRIGRTASRLDKSAAIYLFPESFDELRGSLEIYLKTIFGSDDFAGVHQLELASVDFSSARQAGGELSARLAQAAGRPVDDVPLPARTARSVPYFIRELLGRRIFALTSGARFTRAELFRRQGPAYAVCAALIALAGFWTYSAAVLDDPFGRTLEEPAAYYRALGESFQDSSIAASPLLTLGSSGPVTALEAPMAGAAGSTRQEFFSEAWSAGQNKIAAPWGFKAASYLQFGLSGDLARADRRFIFDQVQTQMAYLPALTLLEHRFMALPAGEPLTEDMRDAVFAFLDISNYRSAVGWTNRANNPLYDTGTLEAFLEYLYPEMSADTIGFLTTFDPKHDRLADRLNASIVLSPEYGQASQAAIQAMLESYAACTAYPESSYQDLRRAADAAQSLEALYDRAAQLAGRKSGSIAAEWDDIAGQVTASGSRLSRELHEVLMIRSDAGSKVAEAAGKLFSKATQAANLPEAGAGAQKTADPLLARADRLYADWSGRILTDLSQLEAFQTNKDADLRLQRTRQALSPEHLAALKVRIEKNLEQTHAELTEKLQAVLASPLFSRPAADDDAVQDALSYECFMEFARITRPQKAPELARAEDFTQAWQQIGSETEAQRAELSKFLEKHGKDPAIEPLAAFGSRVLDASETEARLALARALVAFYPQTQSAASGASALAARIGADAKKSGAAESDAAFRRSALSILGAIPARPEFQPETAAAWLEPMAILISEETPAGQDGAQAGSPAEGKDQGKSALAESLRTLPGYAAARRAVQAYAREYIRWWGTAADSVALPHLSWQRFRSYVHATEAYLINSELSAFYDRSADALAMLPAASADSLGAQERTSYQTQIDARRKLLTVSFSERCAEQLAAWNALPESAREANRRVSRMPAAQSSRLYGGAKSKEGGIPWWSAFTKTASAAMKDDATDEIRTAFAGSGIALARFPLIRDAAPNAAPLSAEDLVQVSDALSDFGVKAQTGNAPADPLAGVLAALAPKTEEDEAGLAEPLPMGAGTADIPAWAGEMQTIAETLLEKKAPLTWTLLMPAAAQHDELARKAGAAPSALARFRYAEASASGKASHAGRIATFGAGTAPAEIASGSIRSEDIAVKLFRFSDDAEAETEVRLTGPWAALRIWLAAGGTHDAKNGIVWAPFTVTDRLGAKSTLVLGIRMSLPLTAPEAWPATADLAAKP